MNLRAAEEAFFTAREMESRAIRLYERLGFIAVAELQRWYKIF